MRAVEPILHDGGKRRAALMVNLSTSDLAGSVTKARAAVTQGVILPPGYRIEFGGQYHQLEAAHNRLSIVAPAALWLIFLLVYAALGSVKEAAIVYTGIPFAVTGGVLALWLRGMPFSITATIGFIALSGIAMLNGLVLIDHINSLRDGREGDKPLFDRRRRPAGGTRPVAPGVVHRPRRGLASCRWRSQSALARRCSGHWRPSSSGASSHRRLSTFLLLPSLYHWLAGHEPAKQRQNEEQVA